MDNIRRLFLVIPGEARLRDETDDTAYFPQQDGSFDVQGIGAYSTLIVEGPIQSSSSVPQAMSFPHSVTLSSTPSSSSHPVLPPFQSVTAPQRTQSFNLKVVKANITSRGCKPIFEPLTQTYIELTESFANLEHISSVVCCQWGPEYALVTNDGIKLEHSSATEGMNPLHSS